MFKKIISLMFILLFVSSCFFSGEENDKKQTNLLKTIDRKDFSILLPESWEFLTSKNSIFPKPAYGEIVFDAVSKKKNDNFYRNILVLKEDIGKNIDSLDYISSNYVGAKKNYYYFKDLEKRNVKIDNKDTRIYVFEARYSEDTPLAKFIQTGIVCDNSGYIITIALEKTNKNVNRYLNLLGSFKCKKMKKG